MLMNTTEATTLTNAIRGDFASYDQVTDLLLNYGSGLPANEFLT